LRGDVEGDERQEKNCGDFSRRKLSNHADLVLLSGLWIGACDQGPVLLGTAASKGRKSVKTVPECSFF
jgi:hypothetical protein